MFIPYKSDRWSVLDTHVFIHLRDEFCVTDDHATYSDEVTNLLNSLQEPKLIIMVIGNVSWSIQDVMVGASEAARGKAGYLRHKNLKELIVVTMNRMLQLSAQGMNNRIFGSLKVRTFETYDQALDNINR